MAIDVGQDRPRLFKRMGANGESLYPEDYIVLLQDVVYRSNMCSRYTVQGDNSHGGLARLRQEASKAAHDSCGTDAEAFWNQMASDWQQEPPLRPAPASCDVAPASRNAPLRLTSVAPQRDATVRLTSVAPQRDATARFISVAPQRDATAAPGRPSRTTGATSKRCPARASS